MFLVDANYPLYAAREFTCGPEVVGEIWPNEQADSISKERVLLRCGLRRQASWTKFNHVASWWRDVHGLRKPQQCAVVHCWGFFCSCRRGE